MKYFIKIKVLRLFIFLFALFWFIGIISPCLELNFLHLLYPYLKLTYSTVCHQDVHKSFYCADNYLLVCARCTGIYFSVLIISLLVLILNVNIKVTFKQFVILSIPMLIDVIFYSIGIYKYNKIIVGFTGILFGSVVFLYILSAIENSLSKRL